MNKQKKHKQEKTGKVKKPRKGALKVFLYVFSSLAIAGMLAGGHFLYKSCHQKEAVKYTIKIIQPESPEIAELWVIEASTDNITFATGQIKAEAGKTVFVRARLKQTNLSANDIPEKIYKICIVFGEGYTAEYPFEYDTASGMYVGNFPMFERDVSLFITAKNNISQFIYTKIDNEEWILEDKSMTTGTSSIRLYKFSTLFDPVPKYRDIPRINFNMPIYIGAEMNHVPESFLSQCENFDSLITFEGNKVLYIGNNFLWSCSKFNQPITFPDSLIAIGHGFLYCCESFNQPINTKNVKYLYYDDFDAGFLSNCSNFNSKLEIPNVEYIPQCFLLECRKFDQELIIPACVKKINNYFMYECDNFCDTETSKLIVNCSAQAFTSWKDNRTLSVRNYNSPAYQKGIKLDGTLARQMPEMFPEISIEGEGYRRWRL